MSSQAQDQAGLAPCHLVVSEILQLINPEPSVEGRIILKWIFEKWEVGMDWIDQAQDRVRWQAVVNAVMNLRVSKMRRIS